MTSPVLLPTRSCFNDSIEYLESLAYAAMAAGDRALFDRPDLLLVHAIVDPIDSDAGRHAHAWIEDGDTVIQGNLLEGEKIYAVFDRAEFEAKMRIEACTKYTMREVLAENQKHVTYGPWRPEYLALCADAPERETW